MRMLCTGCWRTARPDTRLPGSDRAELIAWLCLGIPGLVYCAWRHAGRARICPACGSGHLVREARALRDRIGEAVAWGGGRLRAERAVRWPRGLRTPRARLRTGATGVALGAACAAERALAWLAQGPDGSPGPLAAGLLLAWALWGIWLVARLASGRAPVRCAAFDEQGRSLPIEALRL